MLLVSRNADNHAGGMEVIGFGCGCFVLFGILVNGH